MSAITDNLPAIGWGLLVTLVISVLSYLGGLLLGSSLHLNAGELSEFVQGLLGHDAVAAVVGIERSEH